MSGGTEAYRRWIAKPENRQKVRDKDLQRRQGLRFVSDLLKAQPCMDCGQRLPAVCMDWDHRPGTVKHPGGVARLAIASRTRATRLVQETQKCDLVCANCHRLRTSLRLET